MKREIDIKLRRGMGPIFGVFIILLLFVVGFLFTQDTTYNVRSVLDLVRVQEQISRATNMYNSIYIYSSLVGLETTVSNALNLLAERGLIYVPNENVKDVELKDIFPYARVLFFKGRGIGVWQKVEKKEDKLEWTYSPPLLQSKTLYPVNDKSIKDKRHLVLDIDKRGKLLVIYSSTTAKATYVVKGRGCDVEEYNSLKIDSSTYYGAYLLKMKGDKCKVIIDSSLPIHSFYYFVYSFVPPEDPQPYQLDSLIKEEYYGANNANIKKIIEQLKALGIEKKDQIYALKNRLESMKEEDINKLSKLSDIEFAKQFQAYNIVDKIGKDKVQQLTFLSSSLNVNEKLALSQIIENLREKDPSISLDDIEEGNVKDKIKKYVEGLKNKEVISPNEIVDVDKLTRHIEQLYNTEILKQVNKDEIVGMFMDPSYVGYVRDVIDNRDGIEDQIKEIKTNIDNVFSFDMNIKKQIDECLIYNSLSQMEKDIMNKGLSGIKNIEEAKQLLSKYYELKEYYENPTSEIIKEIGNKAGVNIEDMKKYYNLVAKYNINKDNVDNVISKISNPKDREIFTNMKNKLSTLDIQNMRNDIIKKIGGEKFECSKGNLDLSSLILYSPPAIPPSSISQSHESLSFITTLSKLEYIESEKKRHHCNAPSLPLGEILKNLKHHTAELKDIATYLAIEDGSVIKNVLDNSGYFLSRDATKNLYASYNLFIPRTNNPREVKVVGIRDDVRMDVDTKTRKNAFLLTFHPFIQADIKSNFWLTYDISTALGEHLTSIIIPRLKKSVKDIEDHFYAVTYSCLPKCTYLPDPIVVKKEEYDKKLDEVLSEVEKEIKDTYKKYGLTVKLNNIKEVGIFEDERYNKNRKEESTCLCGSSSLSLSSPHTALKCITHYDHRVIYIPTILVEVKYKGESMRFAIQLPLDDNTCNTANKNGNLHRCSQKEIKEKEITEEGIEKIELEGLLTSPNQKNKNTNLKK